MVKRRRRGMDEWRNREWRRDRDRRGVRRRGGDKCGRGDGCGCGWRGASSTIQYLPCSLCHWQVAVRLR